jgi:O-antigen/teichoic acid export membrane protein
MIKKLIKKFTADSLLRHSSIVFVSSIFVNFLSFVFWLIMVRKLSGEEFGILNVLVSMLCFFSVPIGVLSTVITRYVSKFMAHDKKDEVITFLVHLAKVLTIFLAVFLIILIGGRYEMARFLKLTETHYFIAIGVGLIFSVYAALTVGALLGLQKFEQSSLNGVASGLAKFIFAVLFVYWGWKAYGALWGFVLGSVISFLLSIFQIPTWLKNFRELKEKIPLKYKEIYGYFIPVAIYALSFFSLTNIDIILVKHYFSPLDAGRFSIAQLVGKIVFYFPGAIGLVMFPKIVDSHAKNDDTGAIVKKCLLIVSVLCGFTVLICSFFPAFILKILSGKYQPSLDALVILFALNASAFALVNIFSLYNLSVHKKNFMVILLAMALFEAAGICLFHKTLESVLIVGLATASILLYFGFRSVWRVKL